MPKTLKEVRAWSYKQADDIAKEDIDYVLAERLDLTPSEFELKQDMTLTDEQVKQANKDVAKLVKGDSPQYILGYAWFLGYKIMVKKGVLIPRFETEELVEWALTSLKDKDRVLDLGTGSGCITVALAKEAQKRGLELNLTISDVSDNALRIAEENLLTYEIDALVRKANVLIGLTKFDKIISNPPYIDPADKNLMDKNVIRNEPEEALYGGKDGLEFYRKFAKQVRDHLNSHGEFFLEFGFNQKEALAELFATELADFEIEFKDDLAGNARMVHGRWQK